MKDKKTIMTGELVFNKHGDSCSYLSPDNLVLLLSNEKLLAHHFGVNLANRRVSVTFRLIKEGNRLVRDDDRKKEKPGEYEFASFATRCYTQKGLHPLKSYDPDTLYTIPIKSEQDKEKQAILDEIAEAMARLQDAENKLEEMK